MQFALEIVILISITSTIAPKDKNSATKESGSLHPQALTGEYYEFYLIEKYLNKSYTYRYVVDQREQLIQIGTWLI